MARKLAAVVFSIGYGIQASSVMALGLGELKLESFLNEPLKATVDLLNTGALHEDEIKIRLATRDDFQKLGLDRAYFLTNITFDVEFDDRGRAQIVVTSDDPVLEPYLDFIVEARWPSGRLLREYTVLIDPPVFAEGAAPAVSASQRVEEVEGLPAPTKKNDEAAATSGTRVGVKKKSDLSPGAMPERDFSAATASSPTPGSRYLIRRDQTLWTVASLARPEGASVHQTMLDIQRLNPDAFINGNINQVKAGYIVQLPSADDISSGDTAAALEEVSEQNAAWREGRDIETLPSSGPSLKISAETDTSADSGMDSSVGDSSNDSGASSLGSGSIDSEAMGSGDTDQVAAMEQQLATLQRIVNVKDEKIAALQAALAEAEGAQEDLLAAELATDLPGDDADESADDYIADVDESVETAFSEVEDSVEEGSLTDDLAVETEAEAEAEADNTPSAIPVTKHKATTAKTAQGESSGGVMDYIYYILGAVVVAIAGFIFARRRRDEDDEGQDQNQVAVSTSAVEDAFSEVELQDEQLEVASPEEIVVDDDADSDENSRGYGERKNDEYASDVEAADALAEADIYIAYGRHPQAIDLLTNALASEPNNPVYRLKLIEIHTELNDRGAATAQFEQLEKTGDTESIERAEALLAGMGQPVASDVQEQDVALDDSQLEEDGPGLSPNPLELVSESGESLEADFSDLEIEVGNQEDDELDLSADFEDSEDDGYDDGEDLVIADDASGLSTKMDLARAYLDMGDDDGARQILEEVVAEGSEELKAEAQELLDRIG